ncbi:MAG: N-glycosylase/DNA lyase [archaeon]
MTKKPKICTPQKHLEPKIQKALRDYKGIWKKGGRAIYEEMCFCILTPQSSAKQAAKSITNLKEHKLLDNGSAAQKEPHIKSIRFFRTKAKRLAEVQEKFPATRIKEILLKEGATKNTIKCREYLIENVNGYGMKEASHFLRNIGFYEDIAILDRHILKNLALCGVIREVPKHFSKKTYLEIEEKMRQFCKKHSIKIEELDLIFWSNETGEVFK